MNTIKRAVQQSFGTKFKKYPPVGNSIKQWYKNSCITGVSTSQNTQDDHATSEERVVHVREAFQHGRRKATKTASLPCG